MPWVTAGIGALGLLQAGSAQRQANSYMQQGLNAQAPQIAAQNANLQQALAYNPAQEDRAAITAANQNAAATLKQQLGGLQGSFQAGGGSPTGDTAFNVASQSAANRTMDPLRQFQAQLASTETQRKIGALQSVYSAPSGQLANTYFQAAGMMNQDPTAALSSFIKGIRGLWSGGAVSSTGQGTNPLYAPGSAAAGQDQFA